MLNATHREISACAYCIWLQEGKPEGRALDHWLEAELQLLVSSILRDKDQRKSEWKKGGPLGVPQVPLPAPGRRTDIFLAQPSTRRGVDDSRV
jgi:hypothetical protein